ncbi:MAG TPA: M48 family metalloprotease [Dongiaceae bacterium]
MTSSTRASQTWRHLILLTVALGALTTSGCGSTATSPATGRTFSTPISTQQEAQMGREEHPKILEEFGGAYTEKPALNTYVQSVGTFIAATSERKDVTYTFTVLNTPDVNAFAVPGGYIYITRGLLALANNEAEMAGVLGHETGHINARHTAERAGQQQNAQLGVLGATLLGAILGGQAGGELAGGLASQYGQVKLAGYSQEQEFEADSLGVRYMKRATYDPQAMATFLGELRAQTQLEAKLAGKDPNVVDDQNMLASHPRTVDRVQRAIQEAGGPIPNAMTARDIYLKKIDGIMFGDDPAQGVIAGTRFVHPPLRFAFEVPSGYKLVNLPDVVAIKGPKGTLGNLTLADPQPSGSLAAALQSYDPKGNIVFDNIENLTINGMEAATGLARVDTKSGSANYRSVLIRHPSGKVYEFVFLSLADLGARYDNDFKAISTSFRQINASEAAQYNKAQRIHVVTVKSGDTVQSLAGRMVVADDKEGWFRVLNNLPQGQQVQPGQQVKIVTY